MTPHLRSIALATGGRLQIAAQGCATGLPVVMLHGITDSWRSFEPVLPHLPASLRVFAPSQRGHGDSGRPGRYRLRDFAADVAMFIETLRLGPALVVGHSMGSAVAMRLAIDRPALVRGLVLAGAFAGFDHNAAVIDFHRSAIEPLRDPVSHGFVVDWQCSTLAEAVAPGFLDMVVRESLKLPAAVWRDAFAGLFDDDFAAQLHRIAAPTQLVWGTRDSFCPRSDQDLLLRRIAGARLTVYEDAGHAVHWERPVRFADDIASFARGLVQERER